MIRFYFRNAEGDIEEFTERVNLDDQAVTLTTQAEQATNAMSTLIVDDPVGDWDIGGHRLVYVHEDEADFLRVWVGYTAERDITRGDDNHVGAGRQWSVTIADLNTILGRRVMVGSDCNRPAETDVERMQWLMATTEMSLIEDTTLLSTLAPVAMDGADYRGQYGTQIIDDCEQASGKNCFVYPAFNTPDWEFAIWYGSADLEDYSSPIRVSNIIADVDNVTTFYGTVKDNLNRSPSRVFSGVYGLFDGGWTYQQRAATATEFARRDTTASWPNVKTQGKADARALRYLETIKTEEDVISTVISVPPSQVNDVLAGHRISARWSHMPGFEDFTYMRVLKRSVTFVTPERYDVALTLSAPFAGGSIPFPVPGDEVDGFACSVDGYVVPWCIGDGSVLSAGPIPGDNSGQVSDATVQLYDGATYRFTFTVDHSFGGAAAGDNNLGAAVGPGVFGAVVTSSTNPQATGTRYNFGSEFFASAVDSAVFDATMGDAGDPCVPLHVFEGAGFFSLNVIGASATCIVTYLSGPDPRFEGLLECPDPEWTP